MVNRVEFGRGMVNRVDLGRRVEKAARNLLITQGYSILFKSIRTRFGCQDFAKLFDIVACKGRERRLISVKTFVSNARHSLHKEEIGIFVRNNALPGETCELWLWHRDTREWEVIRL